MSQAKRPRTEAASTPAWRNFVPQPTLHVTCVYCLPSVCAALCSPRSIRGEIGGKAAAPVSHAEDGDTQMASACDVLSARAMLRGGAQPIQLVTSTGRSVSLGPIAERAPTGHVRSRGIGLRSACSCTSTKYYLLDGSLYIECTPSNPCVRTFNAWENEA
jgi:hypothetical protein